MHTPPETWKPSLTERYSEKYPHDRHARSREDGGLVVGYELPVELQNAGQDLVDTRFQPVLKHHHILYLGQFEQVLISYVHLSHFSS